MNAEYSITGVDYGYSLHAFQQYILYQDSGSKP